MSPSIQKDNKKNSLKKKDIFSTVHETGFKTKNLHVNGKEKSGSKSKMCIESKKRNFERDQNIKKENKSIENRRNNNSAVKDNVSSKTRKSSCRNIRTNEKSNINESKLYRNEKPSVSGKPIESISKRKNSVSVKNNVHLMTRKSSSSKNESSVEKASISDKKIHLSKKHLISKRGVEKGNKCKGNNSSSEIDLSRNTKYNVNRITKNENVKDKKLTTAKNKCEENSFEDIEKKIFENASNIQNKDNKNGRLQKVTNPLEEIITKTTSKNPKNNKDLAEQRLNKSRSLSAKNKLSNMRQENVSKFIDEESGSENDFEELDEFQQIMALKTEEKQSIEVELESTNILWGVTKRKKKSEEDMIREYLRRQVNKSIKGVHENMHKVHVQCLLMHGYFLNKATNAQEVLGAALSIVTTKNLYPPKRMSINHTELLMKWFSKAVKSDNELRNLPDKSSELKLIQRFEVNSYKYEYEKVLMFLAVLRVLGIKSRLIMALHAMTWRVSSNKLMKPNKPNEDSKTDVPDPVKEQSQQSISKDSSRKVISPTVSKNKPSTSKKRKYSSDIEDDEFDAKGSNKKYKSSKKTNSKSKSCSSEIEDDEFYVKGSKKKQKSSKKTNIKSKSYSSSEEFENNPKNSKIKSLKEKFMFWVEVFCEEEEQWISVDILDSKIHINSEDIKKKLNPSIGYIVGYNSDLTVKDVTQRYILNWLSCKKKVRLDNDWWEDVLSVHRGVVTKKDLHEEKAMRQVLHKQPFPKTISEFKDHPLYALQRHLLKYEGIYPPDVAPVGFVRGEPIFSRKNVYPLHGREKWIKEGKTVKVDEKPYKLVKGRPKWDRIALKIIKGDEREPLELFGEWQIEDFVPPTAKDGKVPRNEYGNVELFKPSMLPKGCVYINLPSINRVARKLGIDCAPALVRFEFNRGWSHPVFEGYVVCEEFKDTLMDAWEEEQALAAEREEEKRVKRIYDNWKRLIRGIVIKEQIENKYGEALREEAEAKKLEKIKKEKSSKAKISKTKSKDGKNTKEDKAKNVNARKADRKIIEADCDEHDTYAVKEEVVGNSEEKTKISQENISNAIPSTSERKNLKVDFNSHVSHLYAEKMKSISKSLFDSSDEETEQQKKEKLQNILTMDLDNVSHPNLSDSEDDISNYSSIKNKNVKSPAEKNMLLLDSNNLVSQLKKNTFVSKGKKRKKQQKKIMSTENLFSGSSEDERENIPSKDNKKKIDTDEGEFSGDLDTSSDSDQDFELATRTGNRGRRSTAKIDYKVGNESDADFTDSDDDKTYKPEKKKK